MRNNVLLLNASYEPLKVVSWHRAVVMVLQEKADVVEADDGEPVRSATFSMPMPIVIRLRYFVKIPYKAKVALNRRNLSLRDKGTCQYCGNNGTTIDHIVPRSRGGCHEWTNVTLACSPCNFKKGDRLLSELGWALTSKPEVPRVSTHLIIGIGTIDPLWEPHLGIL
jgi:5-methylcytosine-specific restriction endonuclease McrA